MKNTLSPRKQEARFVLFPQLPFDKRYIVAIVLFIAGLVLQSVLFVPGTAVVFLGVLMLLVKGIDNIPKIDPSPGGEWKSITTEDLARIKELRQKSKKWADSLYCVGSLRGCAFFLIMLFASLSVFVLLSLFQNQSILRLWIVDGGMFLLLFFFTGRRKQYKPKTLLVKLDAIGNVVSLLEKRADPDIRLQPMMANAKTKSGREVPRDVRLFLKFQAAPKEFMGLQIQVSINTVGGRPYPYLYGVFIARKGFDFKGRLKGGNVLECRKSFLNSYAIEPKQTPEVDVLVFRRKTTKTTGYHTRSHIQKRLVKEAVSLVRAMFRDMEPEKGESGGKSQ